MAFEKLHSIYGRILGISSTFGLVSAAGSTGKPNSTAFVMAAQMWGDAMHQTVATTGATISNVGVTIISTDSTSGTVPYILEAPVKNVYKEIHFQTSSTRTVINTDAATVTIGIPSSTVIASTAGSTSIDISSSAIGTAGAITLRGNSTAQWLVVSRTPTLIVST